jgi:hypothetical protein
LTFINRWKGQAFEGTEEGTKGRAGRRGQGVPGEAEGWLVLLYLQL